MALFDSHCGPSIRLLAVLVMFSGMGAHPASASDQGRLSGCDHELIVRLRTETSLAGRAAIPAMGRVSSLVADLHPAWRPAFPAAHGAGARLAPGLDLSAVHVLRFADASALAIAAARLARDPDVLYIEPVFEIDAPSETARPFDPANELNEALLSRPSAPAGALVPGDSLYRFQWALPQIGMEEVWDSGTGTPGILVGVVDTGIETGHPDIAPNVAINPAEKSGVAGVDDDGNGYVDDVFGWNVLDQNPDIEDGFGHGTHIAGIIGAASDGVRGIVGVTWEVGLLAVRMFDDAGRGTNLAGAQGIVYAAERGAHIINMSWGTARLSPVIRDAIDHAAARGAVRVASAGNAGSLVLDSFPGAFDPVITIGSSTAVDGLAGFSNRGPRLDVIAPGVDILSAERGGYNLNSGTSQSAAIVSGVVAHLLYRHPQLGAEEVRSILALSAVDLGRRGWDPVFGYGRISAAAAVAQPSAPVAAIRRPHTLDASGEPAINVLADATSGRDVGGDATYVLEAGVGNDPLEFDKVAQGEGGTSRDIGTVDLAGYPEGNITIRLRVSDASGREAEDRVFLRVDRTAPVLTDRRHVDRLAGRRLEQWVRYQSNERVTGRLLARQSGSGGDFVEILSDEAANDHAADLTGLASLFPGRYEYLIELRDLAGHVSRIDQGDGVLLEREVLPVIDIPSERFKTALHLEEFDLGQVADLEGDGRPELLGEMRVRDPLPGEPASHLTVLGAGTGWPNYEIRFQGAPGFPLAVGDVDKDGSPEVLVADDGGITLISGIRDGSPHSLWESHLGNRFAGGALIDADGDGNMEILFASARTAEFNLLEWRGGGFAPVDLGFRVATRGARFAAGDYDGDGRGEIAFGTLSGELVVVEARGEGFVETLRQPFLGEVANAIVAADLGDTDRDGRREFAISAVGALLDRQERPVVAIYESIGDDRYEVTSQIEFRDKNIPYDNWLAAGDADGDGQPEIAVAQAGGAYLLSAVRNDRFLPVWFAEREGGGRVFVTDLDHDGMGEIVVSSRSADGPLTTIYSERGAAMTLRLPWRAIMHPLGNEIQWQAPRDGARLFDLAIYRLGESAGAGAEGELLESDLADRRVAERPGEIVAADAFRDAAAPPGNWRYALGYTIDDGATRERVLDPAQRPAASPEIPVVVVHPNPANPLGSSPIAISLALADPGPVNVSIVDVAGRVWREMSLGPLPSGLHEVLWDGRGPGGRPLASGVYFVRVGLPRGERTARLVLVR